MTTHEAITQERDVQLAHLQNEERELAAIRRREADLVSSINARRGAVAAYNRTIELIEQGESHARVNGDTKRELQPAEQ